jgi:peptidoglycan/LPS O-acetylase OafA/YrhL
MPRPFVIALLISLVTAGVVVAVIAVRLSDDAAYLWILLPVAALVIAIASVITQTGKSNRVGG